ncbi:tetratricopeptide repeat protein [Candidatus Poribacteria bacterium]|nr:tetratricopeptide repeat protein [Candidatus Poribacteria bacterium]
MGTIPLPLNNIKLIVLLLFLLSIPSMLALSQVRHEWPPSQWEGEAPTAPYPREGEAPAKPEARFREAERAYQRGQWEEALRLYERLAEVFPEIPSVLLGLAMSAAKLGDYPRAIAAFHRAVKLRPDAPGIQEELADAYRRNHQLDEADKWYQRAIKMAKGNAPVSWYIGLGILETERGNFEQARRYYITAVQLHPDATVAYYNLGGVLLKLNRLDEADAAFRAALEQKDNKPGPISRTPERSEGEGNIMALAFFGRGQIAAKRHDFYAARDFYTRAAELDPGEHAFHYALAQVLFRLGDREGGQSAHARYRRARAEAYLREAHQLLNREQWKEALARLQKAVEVDPTFMDALGDRAYVQMRLGEFDAAKQGFEQVLKADPNSLQTRFYLGSVEVELDNLESAESIFLKLIQQAPDFPDSYPQLARVREMKGDLAGAEAAFDIGIQQGAEWAPGYWWRGQIRRKRGDTAGAESDFRRAMQLAPEVAFPKDSLAQLLAEEGRNLDEALNLAKSVVAEAPSPEYRATLALVYHRLHDTEAAQREIERAYQDAPEHPYVRAIRARILDRSDEMRK